jgi:hypothetical protein
MIEGLEVALKGSGELGLSELRRALRRLLDGSADALRFTGSQRLWSRVFRLRFTSGEGTRSVVVKRLGPLEARRGEMVSWRWLPAVGLADSGPGLLAVAADMRGEWVWHVYEDFGDSGLVGREHDAAAVAAAVRLIARVHSRFASHPLLAECRSYRVFDVSWYGGNLRDAMRSLAELRPPKVSLAAEEAELRDRLMARLARLLEDVPRRRRALAEWGGPETLLHGDLWTSNTFVQGSPLGYHARLIDWDRTGVGPMSYDLSTFLLRFPASQRGWILDLYARSLENGVWKLPPVSRLNLLCETAELSRYANCVVWPAQAIARDGGTWGWKALAEVERWFEALEPVIPREGAARAPDLRRVAGAGGA